VTCHIFMSHVTCHTSHITCRKDCLFSYGRCVRGGTRLRASRVKKCAELVQLPVEVREASFFGRSSEKNKIQNIFQKCNKPKDFTDENVFLRHSKAGPGMFCFWRNNVAEMGPSAQTLGCLAQCDHANPQHSRSGKEKFLSGRIFQTHRWAHPALTFVDLCPHASSLRLAAVRNAFTVGTTSQVPGIAARAMTTGAIARPTPVVERIHRSALRIFAILNQTLFVARTTTFAMRIAFCCLCLLGTCPWRTECKSVRRWRTDSDREHDLDSVNLKWGVRNWFLLHTQSCGF